LGHGGKTARNPTVGSDGVEFSLGSRLGSAASNQKSQVRELYDTLSDPLDSIYDQSVARLESMSKSVMDRDGDLEALYETKDGRMNSQSPHKRCIF